MRSRAVMSIVAVAGLSTPAAAEEPGAIQRLVHCVAVTAADAGAEYARQYLERHPDAAREEVLSKLWVEFHREVWPSIATAARHACSDELEEVRNADEQGS